MDFKVFRYVLTRLVNGKTFAHQSAMGTCFDLMSNEPRYSTVTDFAKLRG